MPMFGLELAQLVCTLVRLSNPAHPDFGVETKLREILGSNLTPPASQPYGTLVGAGAEPRAHVSLSIARGCSLPLRTSGCT